MVYEDNVGGVNAGNEVEFFNPPIPGKTIRVTGRVADKYLRRDKPYLVIEATAVDEDGRLLEKLRTYQMKKPDEVGNGIKRRCKNSDRRFLRIKPTSGNRHIKITNC